MSSTTKDINDDEYHLIQDKNLSKAEKNKLEIAKEIQETSPIILENTARNEETLRKLWIVSAICLVFMAIEVTGGYLANSIAIMSDAAHLLSDFLGFIISIVSIYISRRGATHQMSFGYHRAEVIGALVSVTLIWGLTIWLLYEATLRIVHKNEVNGLIMLITAVIGFLFNIVMGLVLAYEGIDHNLHHHHDHEDEDDEHDHGHFHPKSSAALSPHKLSEGNKNSKIKHAATGIKVNDHNHGDHEGHDHDDHNHDDHDHNHDEEGHTHNDNNNKRKVSSHLTGHTNTKDNGNNHNHNHDHQNINLKAALIHVIGDAVQNLGVVIAGAIIYYYPQASIADPVCTFIFSIIVVFTTIRILRDCISVLMEGSPLKFDMENLGKDLAKIRGVVEVHDLHVWSLSIGKLSLSCHLTSTNPQISLKKARKLIKEQYKITHSTIQVELESEKGYEDCAHDLHHEIGNNNGNNPKKNQ